MIKNLKSNDLVYIEKKKNIIKELSGNKLVVTNSKGVENTVFVDNINQSRSTAKFEFLKDGEFIKTTVRVSLKEEWMKFITDFKVNNENVIIEITEELESFKGDIFVEDIQVSKELLKNLIRMLEE